MTIYDPRDYLGGPDHYEDPDIDLPRTDDWQGPEDDDEHECMHHHPSRRCRICEADYS